MREYRALDFQIKIYHLQTWNEMLMRNQIVLPLFGIFTLECFIVLSCWQFISISSSQKTAYICHNHCWRKECISVCKNELHRVCNYECSYMIFNLGAKSWKVKYISGVYVLTSAHHIAISINTIFPISFPILLQAFPTQQRNVNGSDAVEFSLRNLAYWSLL